jgi:glutathione S-transferase
MMLIGMFDSPFVRRVAVSMRLLGLKFEHANWSVGKDFDRIRQYNPLGRVPTLVLDDGEALVESAAILDYLDDLVGIERALLPHSGPARRKALQLIWLALGAADKGRDQLYEVAFRPPDKRHEPWRERLNLQMHAALAMLDRQCMASTNGQWLIGDRMTQADITTCCVLTFLAEALELNRHSATYGALHALCARCERLPEFESTHMAFHPPGK